MRPGIRRRIGTIARRGGAVLLAAVVAGVGYEEVGRRRDRERLPQIGRSVDIGGRSLNIYCSGEGSPAVILDAGAGEPGYAWSEIQPEIAEFTCACWFDRAGLGWSDPGPFPHTSEATARDLHELLHRAGVPPPYVLVGHSLGGLDVRVYNRLYPSEVAGMVLVESAHEDEPLRAPKAFLGHSAPRVLWYPIYLVAWSAGRVGLVRLLGGSAPLPEDPSQRTRDQILEALRRRPEAVVTSMGDASAPDSYAQARAAGGLGDRPLVVLTRGTPFDGGGDAETDRQAAEYSRVWVHEMQAQLARLSTRGRQVVVENAGHGIPEEAPGAVADAVREVVAAVRAGRM
jgi:pimeloyl-ACP methyl ester carboxylesterase